LDYKRLLILKRGGFSVRDFCVIFVCMCVSVLCICGNCLRVDLDDLIRCASLSKLRLRKDNLRVAESGG
jgi:hypothetical protein